MSKNLAAIFAALMTAVTVWALSSCGADPMQNVSERRSAFYTAADDELSLTAVSGVREDPFLLDGKAGATSPYTLITVVPNLFNVDAIYTYTAKTAEREFGGALVVHPFAASFSAEFPFETVGGLCVTVVCGGTARNYEMTSRLSENTIAYDRAIDAAKTEIRPDGSYEIRARLISDPFGGGELCWHVSFFFESGKESGVLLDAVTAKVMAVKR